MIEVHDLKKAYQTGSFTQRALDGVSITFRENEFVAILGPSGSGKTTLLNVLGGLDHADSGEIVIDGVSTKDYKSADWDTYRNHHIGFIFQSYNLIPHQTVLANVELALTLSGVPRDERRARAKKALERVGLGEHVDKKPNQLSGGQAQRVAIARALVNEPEIVLADEPTGALDTETGYQVMNLLGEIASDRLVIMVTHNPDLAYEYATRIVKLEDGRIIDDSAPVTTEERAEMLGKAPASIGASSGGASAAGDDVAKTVADSRATASEVPGGVSPVIPVDPHAAATGDHAGEPGGQAGASGRGSTGNQASSGSKARRSGGKKRASMSFLTALALSFTNLMSKKGRTFLTAFAGSIGIIGIAAILALSNGVNNYIADTEEEALTSYPLTITKSSFDISSLLTATMGYTSSGSSSGDTTATSGDDVIPEDTIMSDMFAQVKNNNLTAFKDYLDSGSSGIDQYVNTIQYNYGITPQIYKNDNKKSVTQLSPSTMSSTLASGISGSALTGGSSSGMEAFSEMLDNPEILDSTMDVVEGRWPESYDEAVLVLNKNGSISDYMLYSLGVYDTEKMNQMTQDALNGEEVTVPETSNDFTYDDALNLTFKVLPAADLYKHNTKQDTWTDMSNDDDYIKQQLKKNGITLKIVGVVKPSETTTSSALNEGVAYMPELTQYLMKQAADSDIVKQQKANKKVDVFTGKTFKALQKENGADAFDMDSMFSIDEDALKNAFTFDSSALSLDTSNLSLDTSSLDTSGLSFDANDFQIDSSQMESLFNKKTMAQIMANAPKFDASKAFGTSSTTGTSSSSSASASSASSSSSSSESSTSGSSSTSSSSSADALTNALSGITLTDDQKEEITKAANELATGFFAWYTTSTDEDGHGGSLESFTQESDYNALVNEYLQTDGAKEIIEPLEKEYEAYQQQRADSLKKMQKQQAKAAKKQAAALSKQISDAMQDYMVNQFAPYMSEAMGKLMTQAAQLMATQMADSMTKAMASATDSLGSDLSKAISGQLQEQMSTLSSGIADGFSVNADAFADAIQFNMDQEDLASLLTSYMNSGDLSYDGNMSKLGYAEEDNPESISIYPVDFPSKESVIDIIDDYNQQMSDEDKDENTIQYSDIAGALMSSVTNIVNTISLVLIAFVSISLVVSSIMIAIITYISVLERRKEIGILRAMGASKGNVANVFNAETIIEGLIAGVFAVAVVYIASVPVNAFVLAGWQVPNVMSLPWTSALILIAISVLLTFIAGLIPSVSASRKDPVEALRSE